MRYLSVCSGIEAATVAWHPLGWTPVAFAEIEPFPSAVLAHHYPSVPNLGDLNAYRSWSDADVDLLVGGTPCQSFSVAGLRKGLDDPRGNLALVYLGVADRYRPLRVVWENVPGVLSSNGGRDFGAFLGGLAELGYGWAYRVLDAQYVRTRRFARAVPQRRRRVFVVGDLRGWRHAAAVLFDRESLCGNPPPRREAWQGSTARTGVGFGGGRQSGPSDVATAHGQRLDWEAETFVAHSLRGEGFDASEDGTGRGTPIVPHSVAVHETHPTLCREPGGPGSQDWQMHAAVLAPSREAVRRLTPTEAERLQGFPDGYTQVPYRGKPAADGPRYKALGNSMAVNCMEWIGERIAMVDALDDAA